LETVEDMDLTFHEGDVNGTELAGGVFGSYLPWLNTGRSRNR